MNIWFFQGNSNIYPILRDSWTIYSNNVFVKLMDKTALLHNKSSLPKDIVPFWGVENLGRGEKLHVNLIYKNNIN
jgi:hypothetical protein